MKIRKYEKGFFTHMTKKKGIPRKKKEAADVINGNGWPIGETVAAPRQHRTVTMKNESTGVNADRKLVLNFARA